MRRSKKRRMEMDGVEVLRRIRAKDKELPVIVVNSRGDCSNSKGGAFHKLEGKMKRKIFEPVQY